LALLSAACNWALLGLSLFGSCTALATVQRTQHCNQKACVWADGLQTHLQLAEEGKRVCVLL